MENKRLLKSEVEGLSDKFGVDGLCLVQSYSKQPTKNGGSFIGGLLSTSEGDISFKAWSNSWAYTSFTESELKGKVVSLSGEVNVFNGTKSIIVSRVEVVSEETLNAMGVSAEDFMFIRYNVEAYYEKYVSILKNNLSEEAFRVFSAIMEKYGERVKSEFAAVSHHDSCRGGLLAHSLKVCQVASIVRLYPNVLKWVGGDLLYLGCAIHDIGKIMEYNMGDISEEGKILSHLVSGAILVASEFGDLISSTMGEKFLYDLLSVVSCHHGEFGEPPRTVAAYVVHLIDKMESVMTSLNEQLEGSIRGDVMQFDGFKLS